MTTEETEKPTSLNHLFPQPSGRPDLEKNLKRFERAVRNDEFTSETFEISSGGQILRLFYEDSAFCETGKGKIIVTPRAKGPEAEGAAEKLTEKLRNFFGEDKVDTSVIIHNE